jgi:hypothetical protein
VGKRVKVQISRARARLFELAELVRRGSDDAAVVLEQRGSAEPLALIREARLDYLEDRVKQIDKRRERPFKLRGSLVPTADDRQLDELLKELRQQWTPKPKE